MRFMVRESVPVRRERSHVDANLQKSVYQKRLVVMIAQRCAVSMLATLASASHRDLAGVVAYCCRC
jgi:hypothetical protein